MTFFLHRSSFKLHRRRCAFTLVEILVVIAILATLAGLLFPVFSRARNMAKRANCVSNLKQIGLAFQMYERDADELAPRLSQIYPAYLSAARVFICPTDSARGQIEGNDRLEGNLYLSSGVSYEYVPLWMEAQQQKWYRPAPDFGAGKWGDLTPLAGCMWHWAGYYNPNQNGNATTARGWQLYLTRGGSVRKVRVENPIEDFSPDKYQ